MIRFLNSFLVVLLFVCGLRGYSSELPANSGNSDVTADFFSYLGENLEFPPEAYNDKITATVSCEVSIDSSGRVERVFCRPYILSMESKLSEIVYAYKWKQMFENGVAMPYSINFEVNFTHLLTSSIRGLFTEVEECVEPVFHEQPFLSSSMITYWSVIMGTLPKDSGVLSSDRFMLTFTVLPSGKLSDVRACNLDTGEDNEAVKENVIKQDKNWKWKPAYINGKKHQYTISWVVPCEVPGGQDPSVEMPTFRGGDIQKFRAWVMGQLEYPVRAAELGLEGKVVSCFSVDAQGNIVNARILQSPSSVLSIEVLRILKLSPKWTPGMKDGNPVSVELTLPIDFSISK